MIYGYADTKEGNNSNKFEGGNLPLEMYGAVRVEFKDSVRDRTTVTFGDSLGETYVPDPIRAVTIDSIQPSSRMNMDKPWAAKPYTEVQIHGQTTTADISRVVFPNGAYQSTLDKLAELGIPAVGLDGQTAGVFGSDTAAASMAHDEPGMVVYRDVDGATITYTGDDEQGRPLGYITRDGKDYEENLIIILSAHGEWEPVEATVTTDQLTIVEGTIDGVSLGTHGHPVELANEWRDEEGKFARKGYIAAAKADGDLAYTGAAADATIDAQIAARQELSASEFDHEPVWRGITIEMTDEMREAFNPPTKIEDVNRQLWLGPQIVEDALGSRGTASPTTRTTGSPGSAATGPATRN